jgi:hypothetical protein
MKFRPRHYVLILVILALGAYNFYRSRQVRRAPQPTAVAVAHLPPGTSPVWAFYDRAAQLRDAPDPQFSPALTDLAQHIDQANTSAQQTNSDELADLRGCRTWLLFYRQARNGGGPQADWRQRSESHVRSCMSNHRDIAN